jgi:ADP-ribosyl-[dinitrogen reductase] hydrolase
MFRMWINNPVPYDSFGNGAAMRIAPVALHFPGYGLSKAVGLVTGVSHNHPEGFKGAAATALAIKMARAGASKAKIRERVVEFSGYNLDFTCDQIRPVNQFDETCQVTVPQALVCFLESTDFESAIRLAVSIGGDSDTIACIVGGIAEAYYGGVPEWISNEAFDRLPDEMRVLIAEFYKKIKNQNHVNLNRVSNPN